LLPKDFAAVTRPDPFPVHIRFAALFGALLLATLSAAPDPAAAQTDTPATQADAPTATGEADAAPDGAVETDETPEVEAEPNPEADARAAAEAAEAAAAAQEAALAAEAAEREARREAFAAAVAALAAEREAAAEAARIAAEAAASAAAAAAAQEAALAAEAAEREARRAAIAAEVARLAAEREARMAAEASVAACMDAAGAPSAAVPVSEAAQRAIFARLREALPLCEEAVTLAPEAGGPLFHMATVEQARGEHRQAVDLYTRSAEAGVGAAHTRLGDYYNFGIGPIRPDVDRAVTAYRAAVEAGDPAGMATLAFMHRLGRGVPRDAAEMVRLFQAAADEGYHFAQANLAQIYLTGEGVPGNADAALGIPNPRAAVPLFAAAARNGNLDAALALGRIYADGAEGVAPNPASRLRWTRVAAEAGLPDAIAALAYLTEQGIGRPADHVAAAQGYVAALETGEVDPAELRAAGGPRPPAWDRQTAIEFQLILQDRGLYNGAIDGIVGPGTLGGARALAD
jgi:TPR repeat protein